MESLQALVDATPAGGTLDLAGRTFTSAVPVMVRGPIKIVGNDARILTAASKARVWPNLIIRGAGVQFSGRVFVEGSKPDGAGYDPDREAQHGVELQGVTDFSMSGWRVVNTWGDAVYVGKHNGRWSSRVTVEDFGSEEIGRQQITLAAVRDVLITNFTLASGNRSVFDLEPPGHDWGAQRVRITDGTVRQPHGYLLACKGVGASGSVRDVHFSHIRGHGRAISAMVDPPLGTRRANFSFLSCESDTLVHSTPLRFNRCDGVLVRDVSQPIDRGIDLVHANDCTLVDVQ